jgi:predicted transcriptional regulator
MRNKDLNAELKPLDAELKTRVLKQHKRKLQEIAISRHLKVSDIMREAIREKIERERGKKAEALI